MHNLDEIRAGSEPVLEYVEACREKAPRLHEQYETYRLDGETVAKIRCHSDRYLVVVFSAEWCPDCHRNVPILALLSREAGLEVRVFGHLMRDAKNDNRRWSIPPSPPEVDDFDVVKIPHMAILDMKGEVVGEIIENSPEGKSLEQALLDIFEG
ncbi:MAG TPA: thioredoxin family protein [Candidatus Krumholzibacteriaceae bacterium]|nr:thioredoxin family protein [Candidatus Krumholzibacteriaceae bacterium]